LVSQVTSYKQPRIAWEGEGLPVPRDVPAAPDFPSVEWHALVNRARASLAVQRTCLAEALHGSGCRSCPFGGSAFPREAGTGQCPCRPSFRATLRRLRGLARSAPDAGRFQMRRTLDCLELEYQQLWKEGGCNE
jgi:hypothetical protein